jgi:hypothetical protein
MKYKVQIGILTFLFSFIALGQNLVPNYSFEDTVAVKVTPLYALQHWDAATNEGYEYLTPFNNLTPQHLLYSAPFNFLGFQQARTGVSYIGIRTDDYYSKPRRLRREYIQLTVCKCLLVCPILVILHQEVNWEYIFRPMRLAQTIPLIYHILHK